MHNNRAGVRQIPFVVRKARSHINMALYMLWAQGQKVVPCIKGHPKAVKVLPQEYDKDVFVRIPLH